MAGYEPGKDKVLDALLDSIMPAEELSPYIKAVIYGPFGVGKSVLACTSGKKILYIDSGENGWVSLLNHPEIMTNVALRMKFISLAQLDSLADKIEDGSFPYDIDTVVIDTVSDIQKKDLDSVMAFRCKKDPEKNPNAPTQPDYNENTNRLRRTLSRYRDLPLNFVMVSQERADKDNVTGIKETRLAVSDVIGKTIAQMAHLVGLLETDGTGDSRKFFLQVHPTKGVMAKTRIGGLPIKVENPNLSEIFSKWSK